MFNWNIIMGVCLVLPLFFVIYYIGRKLRYNEWFFTETGKGTFKGKCAFVIPFAFACFIPLIFSTPTEWLLIMRCVITAVICLEIIITMNKKTVVNGYLLIIFTIISVLILPGVLDLSLDLILLVLIVSIATDTLANILGKYVIPEKWKWKYPQFISSSKSLTASVLAILSVTFMVYLTSETFQLEKFDEYKVLFAVVVGVGTMIGDAYFSSYKREIEIDDFPSTLGPHGGLADRGDGWVFAYFFLEVTILVICLW